MLTIANMSAGYGPTPVLTDFSATIRSGEVLGMLGRNGSGKSTILKAVMNLVPSRSGKISLHDRDLTALKTSQLASHGLAYVPQGRGVFPRLTVEENLRLGLRAGGTRNGSVEGSLADFPALKLKLQQFAGSLSGGEQQQLAIARALASAPKVILLDEPSDGVQPNVVAGFADLVRHLVGTMDVAIILVEQNLDLALAASSRVLVLDRGVVIHESAPDVLRDPGLQSSLLSI